MNNLEVLEPIDCSRFAQSVYADYCLVLAVTRPTSARKTVIIRAAGYAPTEDEQEAIEDVALALAMTYTRHFVAGTDENYKFNIKSGEAKTIITDLRARCEKLEEALKKEMWFADSYQQPYPTGSEVSELFKAHRAAVDELLGDTL